MTVPTFRSCLATTLLCWGITAPLVSGAQIPTQCLEIESILVDACNPASACPGSTEGENEMVRFKTGQQAIALSELEADWPNNNWLGLVQNATTASLTAQLNATIESCGWLLEPPGGVIPAGSTVLLVTSTDMCVAGNSFTALADTIYMVFQEAGNTSGHFANNPASGQPISPTPLPGASNRSLILFYLPTNCSDTATYVRELLVNDQGTYGGMGGESDGGTAVFTWPGVPQVSYVNFGCQAPFNPLYVQAEATGVLCGGTGTVSVTAEVIGGTFTSVLWSGGTGTFADPTSLTTTYTAGVNEASPVVLQLCAQTDCANPICGSVAIAAGAGPTVTIIPDGPLDLCPGDDVVLTATGADSYVWGGGETSASITATAVATYTVTGTNACGTGTASISTTPGTGVSVVITGDTEICPGESTVLTASGATNYVWSTAQFTPSITVTEPGDYSVIGSNGCGSVTEQVTVTQASGPTVSISGDVQICQGETTVLTASGADTYVWSNQAVTPSITVSGAGPYSVTGTSACGTANASVTVVVSPGPNVAITGDPGFCEGESTTLTATGADSYVWSTSAVTTSITVSTAGSISVTGTNSCGTGTATVQVVQAAVPTVVVSGAEVLCPGDEVVLTATASGPVTWNTSTSGPSLTVTSAGLYVATVTNACGSASDGLTVTASPLAAGFTASPTSGAAPLTVSFTNTTTPATSTYDWDFDGAGTSSSPSPTNVFSQPGSYAVELTASLDDCVMTVLQVITVSALPGGPSSIVVPNVFTPNGDHHNDLLVLTAVNITSLEMQIYNRWGQKVNELKRTGEVWDARSVSGDLVPDGTYFYVLAAKGTDGKSYDLTGHITILR